jgi:hypothetical protein
LCATCASLLTLREQQGAHVWDCLLYLIQQLQDR